MNKIRRREAMKIIAVAGGLSTLGSAAAEDDRENGREFSGNWIYNGQSCAIFQQGPILLLVNERGSLSTARITEPNSALVVLRGEWETGLTGGLVNDGRELRWSNGTIWKRS